MIYIYKKITPNLLRSFLLAVVELGATRFVIWFLPETTERKRARLRARFKFFEMGCEVMEPVTLYSSEPVEKTPMIFRLDKAAIEKLISLFPKVERYCDNLAVYKTDSPDFLGCTIFHEQMSILKKTLEADTVLSRSGISFTYNAPIRW